MIKREIERRLNDIEEKVTEHAEADGGEDGDLTVTDADREFFYGKIADAPPEALDRLEELQDEHADEDGVTDADRLYFALAFSEDTADAWREWQAADPE